MSNTDEELIRFLAFDWLCKTFSVISEENWCAGWWFGIERLVYESVFEDKDCYNIFEFRPETEAGRIIQVAEHFNLWVACDDPYTPTPIALDEYRRIIGVRNGGGR